MTTPILVRLVIDFVSDGSKDTNYGICLVTIIVVSRLLICLFDCHASFHFVRLCYLLSSVHS